VAPFRAFLAEREVTGATGKNWLFFGDRNFHSDFLYQLEWLDYRKNGLLTRIDVAFSRDSEEKLYVQHRMLEKSSELYAWLEEGAYFYVCGDAQRMAPDVHVALVDIVAKEGGYAPERAEEYVRELQSSKRYQRDVY
jgi:sulfite reductase (NADPH) flavoprotein alpha-component